MARPHSVRYLEVIFLEPLDPTSYLAFDVLEIQEPLQCCVVRPELEFSSIEVHLQGVNLKTFNANISRNKKVRKTPFGTNSKDLGLTITTILQ